MREYRAFTMRDAVQACAPVLPSRSRFLHPTPKLPARNFPPQVPQSSRRERALRHRPLHLELGHVAHRAPGAARVPAGPEPGGKLAAQSFVVAFSGLGRHLQRLRIRVKP
jgi:hypothetical protein